MDVLADKLRVALEAAGGEDVRLLRRRGEPDVARGGSERLRHPARIEALADRARVARLVPDDRRTKRLEPRNPVVEVLPDRALQAFVAGRAFGAKVLPLAETPDHTARQQHR